MNELIPVGFGYLASVLLAISLLINNDLKFRWFNTGGSMAFIVYGILIHAFPVILTNAILLMINLFYLVRIYRTEEAFDLIEFRGGEQLVLRFLSFYSKDIALYFPSYVHEKEIPGNHLSFVVLRDLVIANIFVATLDEAGTAEVRLNYTVARYRDYKVGRFIFNRENKFLLSKGVQRLVYKQALNKQHERFIRVMGFTKEGIDEGAFYTKQLA